MSNVPNTGAIVPVARNSELAKLIRDNYSLADLTALRATLAAKGSLSIRRYSSGGHSAVSVLNTEKQLESAVDGLLVFQWDRDNIMQVLAELTLAESPWLNTELKVGSEAWKRGMLSSVIHHRKGESRFLNIIHGRASGYPQDYMQRPHIRYNPISLHEVGDPWGHGQNDSLSFVNFMVYHALKTGRIKADDASMQDINAFATLLHAYFWTIHAWEDHDLGAWEDKVAQHWSSVACVLVGLREQLDVLSPNGAVRYDLNGHSYLMREQGVREMIDKCEAKLNELGTKEFVPSQYNSDTRNVDLAQINPLLLAAFAGKPVLNDANTVAILENVERELMGPIGVRRYRQDLWDGRVNRFDLGGDGEAQWCHGSPQMSYIYGELYQRTGDEKYFQKQLLHFNRGLASIPESWLMPEAWIIDNATRQWVPDANEPLAWATSMLVLSFGQMQKSIAKKEAAAALVAASAATAAEAANSGK